MTSVLGHSQSGGKLYDLKSYKKILDDEKIINNNTKTSDNLLFNFKNKTNNKLRIIQNKDDLPNSVITKIIDLQQNLHEKDKNKIFKIYATIYNNTPRSEYTKNHYKLTYIIDTIVPEFKTRLN